MQNIDITKLINYLCKKPKQMTVLETVNNLPYSDKFDLWMQYYISQLEVKYHSVYVRIYDQFDDLEIKYLGNQLSYSTSPVDKLCKTVSSLNGWGNTPYTQTYGLRIYEVGRNIPILSFEEFYKVNESIDRGENWKEKGFAQRHSVPFSEASNYYNRFTLV